MGEFVGILAKWAFWSENLVQTGRERKVRGSLAMLTSGGGWHIIAGLIWSDTITMKGGVKYAREWGEA